MIFALLEAKQLLFDFKQKDELLYVSSSSHVLQCSEGTGGISASGGHDQTLFRTGTVEDCFLYKTRSEVTVVNVLRSIIWLWGALCVDHYEPVVTSARKLVTFSQPARVVRWGTNANKKKGGTS